MPVHVTTKPSERTQHATAVASQPRTCCTLPCWAALVHSARRSAAAEVMVETLLAKAALATKIGAGRQDGARFRVYSCLYLIRAADILLPAEPLPLL